MTKKETKIVESSVEEKLRALYALQLVDSRIDELRLLAGELPSEVKNMGDELEGLKTRMTKIKADIKNLDANMADYKIRINNSNASIERYKTQQDNVRNNREYDNLTKEIEYQQLEIELSEKNMKKIAAELDAKKEEKAKTQAEIDDKTIEYNQKKGDLDKILQENKAEMDARMLESSELGKTIEERLLQAYKRIRKNARNGLAVVKIERDSCGGCHSKIPAQKQIEIKQRKKIMVCEFCGRILVDMDIDEQSN